jgi:hypothetical protein
MKETLEIAKKITSDKKIDDALESKDVMFLDFISKQDYGKEWIKVDDLYHQFKNFIGYDDEEHQKDKWPSVKWVGRALKRLSLIVDKRRMGHGMDVTIDKTKAEEKIKAFRT